MLNGVTDGTCATDVFQVTGQNVDNQIPPICGLNNGQHSKLFQEVIPQTLLISHFQISVPQL